MQERNLGYSPSFHSSLCQKMINHVDSFDEKRVGRTFLFELSNKTYILGFWKSRLTN